MTLSCQGCDAEIPSHAREAVENDELDEVVMHVQDGDEPFMTCKTAYYCSLECVVKAQKGT